MTRMQLLMPFAVVAVSAYLISLCTSAVAVGHPERIAPSIAWTAGGVVIGWLIGRLIVVCCRKER